MVNKGNVSYYVNIYPVWTVQLCRSLQAVLASAFNLDLPFPRSRFQFYTFRYLICKSKSFLACEWSFRRLWYQDCFTFQNIYIKNILYLWFLHPNQQTHKSIYIFMTLTENFLSFPWFSGTVSVREVRQSRLLMRILAVQIKSLWENQLL